jgi:putative transposase
MGKKRIAHCLTIAGLKISSSSVGRFLNQKPPPPKITSTIHHIIEPSSRKIAAKYPNHVWHIDLTVVPTSSGFRTAWFPFSLPQRWPFAYWVAVIIDHFSRKIVGFAVFNNQPDSLQIRSFLGRTIHTGGQSPKYIISDKGSQFWHATPKLKREGGCKGYKRWCRRRKIQHRFGAIGKYGSIAIVERMIRSLKSECTRKIIIPLSQSNMRFELGLYFAWYNEFRPHQGIGGKIPMELFTGISRNAPQYDPRKTKLNLHVAYLHERPHLPIISLERAA